MQPSSTELRYRDFFENVPVGLIAVSLDGNILDANPAMVAMLRYPSRESLLEARIGDFQLDPADKLRVAKMLEEGGEIFDLEVQLDRHDGTTVWLLTSARAARDENGKVLYYQGAVEDISKRKLAEEAERRNARRFADLFESSPDAIFVHDLGGTILDVNPVACALCGQSHGEMVGRKMDGLIPEEKLAEMLNGVPRLARGEVIHTETTISAGDGRSTPIAISCSRIEFTGRPAMLLHARDTSEQKRLQEQIAVRRLLKSWAMPPARRPIASIFCAFTPADLARVARGVLGQPPMSHVNGSSMPAPAILESL